APADPGRDIRYIRHPKLIWSAGAQVSFHQVDRAIGHLETGSWSGRSLVLAWRLVAPTRQCFAQRYSVLPGSPRA
ncbi:hypothetical protein AB6A68_15235, partial [Ferrimicrobium acidiphilum]